MDQLIVGLLEFSRTGRQPLDLDIIDMTASPMRRQWEVQALYTGFSGSRDRELPAIWEMRPSSSVWSTSSQRLKYSAKRLNRNQDQRRIEGREAIYQVDDGAGFDMRYATSSLGSSSAHRTEEFCGTGSVWRLWQRIIARHGAAFGRRARRMPARAFNLHCAHGSHHDPVNPAIWHV